MRPHVAALYAFARVADDFADEGRRTAEERLRLLDDWQNRLHACIEEDGHDPGDPIFLALSATIRARSLPIDLFDDLLSAFRQDITTHRYPTWDAVLDYCRRSANPVGRLVLRIAGYDDRALDQSSDALCTALQLTNFWQDLDRDWQRGRLYVPLEDVDACHADIQDLDDRRLTDTLAGGADPLSPRAREKIWFGAGRHVCNGVRGRLRPRAAFHVARRVRILDRLERADYNVFATQSALGVRERRPSRGARSAGGSKPRAARGVGVPASEAARSGAGGPRD